MTGATRWPSGYSQDVDWSLLGLCQQRARDVRAGRTGAAGPADGSDGGRNGLRRLRCGAFVTGGQHGSGPAAAAPMVRRGKELRSELVLRVFAVERFLRFLIIGAAAYGVWWFKYDQAGVQRAYNNALPAIRALYQDLGFDVSHSKLLVLVNHALTISPRWLTILTIGLPVYAVIELVESVGLWLGQPVGRVLRHGSDLDLPAPGDLRVGCGTHHLARSPRRS